MAASEKILQGAILLFERIRRKTKPEQPPTIPTPPTALPKPTVAPEVHLAPHPAGTRPRDAYSLDNRRTEDGSTPQFWVRSLLRDPRSVQGAFLLKELLDKPVALRGPRMRYLSQSRVATKARSSSLTE